MNTALHTALASAAQLLGRLWHRCRNPRCRVKLSAPAENEHHAFCTRGCYESFHRNRCRVCERDLRKTGKRGDAGRLYCRPPADCRREAEKWPEKYAGGLRAGFPETKLRSAHSTGLKIGIEGDRPSLRCLARYRWGGDPDRGDHSLYDEDGLTVARIVLQDDGRYHLRTPIAIPRQSWRDLDAAMHGAESLALAAMPPPPKLAAHIKKIDATPHPMGPPLDRQHWEPPSSRWTPTGAGADVPDIPDFLKRTLANSRAVPTAAREGPPDAINLGRSSSSSRSKETSNVDAHIHGALARNNPAALDRDTGGEDLRREPTLGTANPL